MNPVFRAAVEFGSQNYPNKLNKKLEYGTAGFRDKSSVLPHVMYRMGLLAVLRSKAKKGATIGVMITASHNPEDDNGVKLCDPMGEMIEADWEILATDLANANTDELVYQSLQHICDINKIDYTNSATVFLGRDTRISSPALAEAVSLGVKNLNGILNDYGMLSTPQLHFMVCCKNTEGIYGTPTPSGYYQKLSSSFLELNSGMKSPHYDPCVYVDGANGIGAHVLKELIPFLNSSLDIVVFNDGTTNLNYKCGADYVKIQQTIPVGAEIIPCHRYASLDGDADRLIYFYLDQNNKFHMLDGDKIAALIAKYLMQLVEATNLNLQLHVVQTAYANGSSTNFIKNVLKIPVVCVPTGVKYLHHEAMKYDVGIYFEANGHGTVVFGKNIKMKINEIIHNSGASDSQRKNCEKLLHAINLINETVGDAISDMLLVETMLRSFDWSISDWDKIYCDLPYRQLKVKVMNKSLISTTDAGRVCVTPVGLQDSINTLIANYQNARSFVRPSGTEDIVRVYAEANTQEHADLLAHQIAEKVKTCTEM